LNEGTSPEEIGETGIVAHALRIISPVINKRPNFLILSLPYLNLLSDPNRLTQMAIIFYILLPAMEKIKNKFRYEFGFFPSPKFGLRRVRNSKGPYPPII
jgi:hypothetical protein